MNSKIIDSILNQKKELIQLILIAFLLALGVNLISSVLPQILKLNNNIIFVLGILFIIISLGYLMIFLARSRTGKTVINAVVIYDKRI